MHFQSHVMSGWCVGNLFKLDKRERFFCMFAACLADLDGLAILGGWGCYQDWHHVLGHNIAFCTLLSLGMAFFSKHRIKAFFIYAALFGMHMLMDLFGSGEGWYLFLYWPFSMEKFYSNHYWAFYSWQNLTAGGLLLAWTIAIIYCQKRTPLEYIMPKLDRRLVIFFLRIIHPRKKRQI